jgi:hypothetical protein
MAERDPEKRTEITDRMEELVSNTWIAEPIIEGMGYYAINSRYAGRLAAIPGRHELGRRVRANSASRRKVLEELTAIAVLPRMGLHP